MTDNDGNAQFKDLTPGRYQVNAELLGYKPFRKEYDLSGYKKDLGVIKMEENPEYIDAATITAAKTGGIMIYADNAATTRMSETALEKMLPFFREDYGNPSSLHRAGNQAAAVIEDSREAVAKVLGCESKEIFFRMIMQIIMNNAAGIPFPDTSAISNAR